MTTGEEQQDLISVIISDHRAVEQAFAELEGGAGAPDHRREVADHVIAELVRHSVAEEQFMYPAVRQSLDNGDQIADKEIADHSEAEQVMKRLESMGPEEPEFEQLLTQLISDVRKHVTDEENNLLPKLRAACSDDQLRDLGQKVQRAKKMAPTRPHPSAPDQPPANLILAPGTAFIDKIRDALTGRKT